MNPSSSESPGLNLPPVQEQLPPVEGGAAAPGEARPSVPEAAPAAPEAAPMHGQPVATPLPVAPLPPVPPAAQTQAQSDVAATTSPTALQALSDEDLIEKEWVNKAKAIVERTRDDPYKQSEALTEVKADYLQKRYGKTVKVNK